MAKQSTLCQTGGDVNMLRQGLKMRWDTLFWITNTSFENSIHSLLIGTIKFKCGEVDDGIFWCNITIYLGANWAHITYLEVYISPCVHIHA